MISIQPINEYLNQFHPEVYAEISDRLKSIPCDSKLANQVFTKANEMQDEVWKVQLLTIASVLALCSPETLYVGCRLRLGVASTIAPVFGLSRQRVCQKIQSAAHYYKNINWCRDGVEQILKEVKEDGKVNG